MIDRNILNEYGIADDKVIIQSHVTNPIGNGVVYGESVSNNLLQTIPSISATEHLMGFRDSVAYGTKDLVLVDKEVIAKGGDEIIPIPNPNRGLIGFSVLGIVLGIVATATNEIVNDYYDERYNKTTNWVAWQLNGADLGANGRYQGDFRRDYTIPNNDKLFPKSAPIRMSTPVLVSRLATINSLMYSVRCKHLFA